MSFPALPMGLGMGTGSRELMVDDVAQQDEADRSRGMVRFSCECGTHVAAENGSDSAEKRRCHRCRRREARRAPVEGLVRS